MEPLVRWNINAAKPPTNVKHITWQSHIKRRQSLPNNVKRNLIQRISHFLKYTIWRKTESNLTKGESLGYTILKTILLAVRGFREHKVLVRADALAFALLFATVPIVALMFAISRGFGFEGMLEDTLLSFPILQQLNAVPLLMEFVNRYLETAQGGVFIGVGFIMLLWSVYYFFSSVESSFNDIWSVRKSRNIVRQITTYIIIVIAIPVLIICTSGISIFVNSNLSDTPFFAQMAPVKEFFMRLSPFVIAWLFYSWIYWAIPNTKVGAAAAFIPGILIGTLFQVLQMISVWIIAFLGRYSIVYGAFAAIPLILFMLEWISVLTFLGAEISYAIQNKENYDYHTDMEYMSRRYKDYITLYITYIVVHQFEKGNTPPTAHKIARDNNIPIRLVNNLVTRLVETNIIREVYIENEEEKALMPAIDINQLTIGRMFEAIESQGTEQFLQHTPKKMKEFWHNWKVLQKDPHNKEILIKDIIS